MGKGEVSLHSSKSGQWVSNRSSKLKGKLLGGWYLANSAYWLGFYQVTERSWVQALDDSYMQRQLKKPLQLKNAQKFVDIAGEKFQEIVALRYLAVEQQLFKLAKFSWYAIGTKNSQESGLYAHDLELYNKAENNMEHGMHVKNLRNNG
ncbi:hypothetical protein E3N88_42722 [Mikania micrantha]|uniref:Uncharacterized protein n=1 Tax=Mikania micrantha TaxID=192012 RepID=A0A5N6LGX2_9ASTR|nr:hypothetical protein E3N88_44851 [Mikania micrantha]KAD1501658.1 hypothetical protein E3N88_42722 [Mikania micrantha]